MAKVTDPIVMPSFSTIDIDLIVDALELKLASINRSIRASTHPEIQGVMKRISASIENLISRIRVLELPL